MAALKPYGRQTGAASLAGGTAEEAVARPAVWTPPVEERRLRIVLRLIESGARHSVRDLASKVSLSPSHLQRLFKGETGVRMSDVLVEHRLRHAALLLSRSETPIKQIAFAVGYGHASSFVRAFRRRFGQPPQSWRRKMLTDIESG